MQTTKFRGFQLAYKNRDATDSMIRQIDDFPSFFTPAGDRPLIIDCGANIGVSVLEWKTRWPQAQIQCFEPDPFTFKILDHNIQSNDIPAVECFQVALWDEDGEIPFYGDLGATADARGNSSEPAWGDRAGCTTSLVRAERLSRYIADRDVSFLKLDIEGAEQRVLTEIFDCLPRVSAVYVEVHETEKTTATNSCRGVAAILTDAGFTIEAEPRYDQHALPPHLADWQRRTGATLTQLLCWR